MSVISAYVREDWYYSIESIKEMFLFNKESYSTEEEVSRHLKSYIKELLSRNILKAEKKQQPDEADIEFENYDDSDLVANTKRYKFSFVGIAICQNRIIYVYPKYIGSATALPTYEPQKELTQVVRVIEKYSREKTKQDIRDIDLFVNEDDNSKPNTLSVMLFLLEDYASNGPYETDEAIIEINGSDNILWQKTIDDTYPIITDNRPLYVELYTQRNVCDDYDFIRRLHAYVVTSCSYEIDAAGLNDFFSLPYAEISDDEIDSFGDTDYILEKLDLALSETFDDRKIMVLKAMKLYFKSSKMLVGDTEIQLIGTRSFNLIWEEVCAKVFKSQKADKSRHPDVTEIEPNIDYSVINKEFTQKPPTLVELIKQPIWKKYKKGSTGLPTATLKPDYLRFENTGQRNHYIFYILDAKYYCPVWTDNKIEGQPGVEDVAKQYMYFIAYKDILKQLREVQHQTVEVKNYFLMPQRENDPKVMGYVKFDVLKDLDIDIGLGVVEVRMLSPTFMFNHYLNNTTANLADLQ